MLIIQSLHQVKSFHIVPVNTIHVVQYLLTLFLLKVHPVKMLERSLFSTRYCFVENSHRE